MVATGLRLRGAAGRLTARLVPHGVDQLRGRAWVLVGDARDGGQRYEVEEYAAYDDKVVLKLRGVGTATQAAPLVGKDILMPCNGLVDLPEGSYYIFELVGLRIRTRDGRAIGTVRDIVQTGGTPLLAIDPVAGAGGARQEILLPAARSICTEIDLAGGIITIDPPEGLLELYGL
ncbi:MAG: 16S rRNA processing protein RimM [Acidobacteria bacterium]|nr:16S rRNA processing protein RimM [Acidobacteriota bacterium]